MRNTDKPVKIGKLEIHDIQSFCANKAEEKNLQMYLETRTKARTVTLKVNQTGHIILDEGTLMRGITYDEAHLDTISKEGLVAPIFRDYNGDTHYDRAICVFKVPHTQLLGDYYTTYNTYIHNNPDVRNDAGINLRGIEYQRSEEADFLPIDSRSQYIPCNKLAFIIHPSPDVTQLESQILSKGFTRPYKRGYSIPIGLSIHQISGIMPSRDLLLDSEKIKRLKQFFPDKYIATPDGEILYMPPHITKQTENFESTTQDDPLSWIHKLISGDTSHKIRLGVSDLRDFSRYFEIRLQKSEDEKNNSK